jgi:hypothetical protein
LVPHHFCEHFRFSLNNRPRQRSPLFPLLRESQIKCLIQFFVLGSFHRFPFRNFRRMFFEFRFYPIWNRWYANTEIRRDISQDLAILNSSHSLQFLFNCYYNTFSFSRHCLESLLNEILKLHCKQHTHQFATRPHTSTLHNKLLGRGSEVSRGRQFWESRTTKRRFC